jgi:hypothetical protein
MACQLTSCINQYCHAYFAWFMPFEQLHQPCPVSLLP